MARLTFKDDDGHGVEVPEGAFRIGRSIENDLVLAHDTRTSRQHAEIVARPDGWWVRDLGSRNGTWVNGCRIERARLTDGDHLRIGSTELTFGDQFDPKLTEDYLPAGPADALPALSPREREILALLAEGSTDESIAEALYISVATVRSHLDRIRDKTGCRRRSELTKLAMRLGLTS